MKKLKPQQMFILLLSLIASNLCISQEISKDSVKVSYEAGEWVLHRIYECEEINAENKDLKKVNKIAIGGVEYYKKLLDNERFLRLKAEALLPKAKDVIVKSDTLIKEEETNNAILTEENEKLKRKAAKKFSFSLYAGYGLSLITTPLPTVIATPQVGAGITFRIFRF
jgi:hypothetical protein